jgi:hypothetical protein
VDDFRDVVKVLLLAAILGSLGQMRQSVLRIEEQVSKEAGDE